MNKEVFNEKEIKDSFELLYQKECERIYFSPGRVNIIGEHIDYNGGCVLPMAISLGIYGAISITNDTNCVCVSEGFNNNIKVCFDINNLKKTNDFTDYIKGIITILRKHNCLGYIDKGFNLYLTSTLPASSGLSSSAALELLIIHFFNDYFNLHLSNLQMAIYSQEAEREYILVNCGIMDQFAIGMSKKDKAIYLNTNTLEYSYIDFVLDDACLVIINTNKPRDLSSSLYNKRRTECEEALSILKEDEKKDYLCDYSLDYLKEKQDKLANNIYKRAYHAITENLRVKDSLKAMMAKDYFTLGRLLKESHESLKNNYEVTGLNLDTICSYLNGNKEVYGARMTGAGFGGCAIALFKINDQSRINDIMIKLNSEYKSITGLELSYYITISQDKTKRIG